MKISEQYELSKDKYQWVLTEWVKGKDKQGDDKLKSNKTFHSSLKQVCNYIVDSTDTDSLEEYIHRAESIKTEMTQLLMRILDK